MTDFWTNLYKFPRFLISVLIGFFLTTFKPIFKLLEKKENIIIIVIITISIVAICYKILIKMTGLD